MSTAAVPWYSTILQGISMSTAAVPWYSTIPQGQLVGTTEGTLIKHSTINTDGEVCKFVSSLFEKVYWPVRKYV